MTQVAVRVILFTFLPVALAALHARRAGRITRSERIEIYLVYLFTLGVGASGLSGAVGHIFLADDVARSIGWTGGSPFQTEMGFANLALGLLGFAAATRRDGFREATVLVVSVVGIGATIVHLIDVISEGNVAPGNTLQNLANVLKPVLLIPLLAASRRKEVGRVDGTLPHPASRTALVVTGVVGTLFGIGYATDAPLPLAANAVVVSGLLVYRSAGADSPP